MNPTLVIIQQNGIRVEYMWESVITLHRIQPNGSTFYIGNFADKEQLDKFLAEMADES